MTDNTSSLDNIMEMTNQRFSTWNDEYAEIDAPELPTYRSRQSLQHLCEHATIQGNGSKINIRQAKLWF